MSDNHDNNNNSSSSGSNGYTPKKRGRPAVLKNYADPMKSPMAHSSMQVQRLGTQSFTKPLMKVSSNPTATPVKFKTPPRKRPSIHEVSPPSSAGSTKRGRYRGVILKTPVKKRKVQEQDLNSSPMTPHDNVFSSASRNSVLKSSPLMEFEIEAYPPPSLGNKPIFDNISPTKSKTVAPKSQRSKFCLSIDKEGKATIATPSETSQQSLLPSSPIGKQNKISSAATNPATFDTKRVLGLLRQMKSKKNVAIALQPPSPQRKDASAVKPSEIFSEFPPSSPPQPLPSVMPLTPRCTSVFQFKTGFTPGICIDEVLEESQNMLYNETMKQQQQQQQEKYVSQPQHHFVFKLSSGDPLLMTDDPQAELLTQYSNSSAELFYQQLLASPKRSLCFNTPPSLVNLGTPRTLAKIENLASPTITATTSAQLAATAAFRRSEPSTPKRNILAEASVGIQCTPLIQQTMNGSLSRSIPETVKSTEVERKPKDQKSSHMEQDDARLALKKLITGCE